MACWIPFLELDCDKCSDGQKTHYGCEEDSYIPDRWEINGEYYQRCPKKLITQETQHFIRAYNLMKLNWPPYDGGWLRNSNKFVEAMSVIDSEINKLEVRRIKDTQRK